MIMNAEELRQLSDDELQRLRERLLALVPDMTHCAALTYDQAGQLLGGIKYERVAFLVSKGILVAEKDRPRDAHKRISSDQIAWYRLRQVGTDEGLPNPALLIAEMARRAELARARAEAPDTWADLCRYVDQHMAGSDVVGQLAMVIDAVARDIVGALVRDTLGVEKVTDEERNRLAALLAKLTQRGGDAR
jgi:hypothetical protein